MYAINGTITTWMYLKLKEHLLLFKPSSRMWTRWLKKIRTLQSQISYNRWNQVVLRAWPKLKVWSYSLLPHNLTFLGTNKRAPVVFWKSGIWISSWLCSDQCSVKLKMTLLNLSSGYCCEVRVTRLSHSITSKRKQLSPIILTNTAPRCFASWIMQNSLHNHYLLSIEWHGHSASDVDR